MRTKGLFWRTVLFLISSSAVFMFQIFDGGEGKQNPLAYSVVFQIHSCHLPDSFYTIQQSVAVNMQKFCGQSDIPFVLQKDFQRPEIFGLVQKIVISESKNAFLTEHVQIKGGVSCFHQMNDGVFPVGIQAAELAAAQGKGKPGLTVVCGGAVKSIEQITDSAGVPGFFEKVPQLLQD